MWTQITLLNLGPDLDPNDLKPQKYYFENYVFGEDQLVTPGRKERLSKGYKTTHKITK